LRAGVDVPVRDYHLACPDGRTRRIPLAFPDLGIALFPLDSKARFDWDKPQDSEKFSMLHALGWKGQYVDFARLVKRMKCHIRWVTSAVTIRQAERARAQRRPPPGVIGSDSQVAAGVLWW